MKDKIIRGADFVLYWSIVLLPFWMAITPGMMNTFFAFIIVSFLTRSLLAKTPIFGKNALNLPFAAFFAATCASLLNTSFFKDSLNGGVLRLLQYILLFYAVCGGVRDHRHLKRIFIAATAGILLSAIDAVYQVSFGKDFIRGYDVIVNIGLRRATASFKDSNMLGIYLSAFVPILLAFSLYFLKGKGRLAGLFLSASGILGILLTYSRPTLLALYIVFWIFAIVRRHKILVAGLLILTIASPFIAPQSVKDWAKDVEYDPLRFMCNDDRIAVYRNAIHMIKAHPVIGVGANAFMSSYKFYKEYPEYRGVVTLSEMKAHNMYLQMAGELGLVGLGIFIWLLIVLFREGIRFYHAQKDDFLKISILALIACISAFLINGLTESSLQYSRVGLIFFYLGGLLFSFSKHARHT